MATKSKKKKPKKIATKKEVRKTSKKVLRKKISQLPGKKPKAKKVLKNVKKNTQAPLVVNKAKLKPETEKIKKSKKKQQSFLTSTNLQALESFKPKIKVVGIGGGGGSIVSEIGRSLQKATFMIADTDVRAFKKRQGIKQFLFGRDLTHGLGTGLNVDIARQAAEREKDKILEIFQGQDIVIFIACLGGGLGSGATQVFLEQAKEFEGITLGIFTLPFRFEGKAKQKIALKALRELRPF